MKGLINYINEGRKPLDVEQSVNDSVSGQESGFDYVDLGLQKSKSRKIQRL